MKNLNDENTYLDNLTNIGIQKELIHSLMLRNNVNSEITVLLKALNEKTNMSEIMNLFVNTIIKLDVYKPLSYNKSMVSQITGLTHRKIDELRRSSVLKAIILSGSEGAGRKTILFKPSEVEKLLEPSNYVN